MKTRQAMLDGIRSNDIIVGAYTDREGGVCPMLAAHRCGGRTSFVSFARAWDRFTQAKHARPATDRELKILEAHLEASLLAEEEVVDLHAAIRDHKRLVAARPARRRDREGRIRPGDPDRSKELRRKGGWQWLRPFRRLDDYERALAMVEAERDRLAAAHVEDDARDRELTTA
ncbi:hypothetical protein [Conexibacter sp. SYSU D00693]|uniref:hypothetical protein n=1 Tax=Conexibacter sp. SYSU D00693 TaxID=2812560 RepID=UPI00196B8D3F|nr:hypothetical protein [Conexibacter sp. SYSU D00693]